MPLSGREATLLSMVAEEPHTYSVRSFRRQYPDASEQTIDVVAAMVGEERRLRGKSANELQRIQKTAKAMKAAAEAAQEYWSELLPSGK